MDWAPGVVEREKQIPFGNDRKKSKSKCMDKNKSRFFIALLFRMTKLW